MLLTHPSSTLAQAVPPLPVPAQSRPAVTIATSPAATAPPGPQAPTTSAAPSPAIQQSSTVQSTAPSTAAPPAAALTTTQPATEPVIETQSAATQARAQMRADPTTNNASPQRIPPAAQTTAAQPPTVAEATAHWLLGAYIRHAWVPQLFLKPIFERAAGINNSGFGVVVSRVSPVGITAEFGIGYQPYHFEGAFNPGNKPIEDTEYVKSTLGLLHVTGSILWPIELTSAVRLELGIGADIGAILGSLRRTEAYPNEGEFQPCRAALDPALPSPNRDDDGKPIPYCEQAFDDDGDPTNTSGATRYGAHYNDRETRVPPLMLIPMLPRVALRIAPVERVAIKLEAAFGLAQFWIGASVHIDLTSAPEPVVAPQPEEVLAAAAPTPVTITGRVIGKLMDASTKKPIAFGSVKHAKIFSPIQTDAAGLFVFDHLSPGPLRLTIAHADYNASTCSGQVPPEGGDVYVHCFLQSQHQTGALSGRVTDQAGVPIPAASVTIGGPSQVTTSTDTDSAGAFALLEAPIGHYRLQAQAPGYLPQSLEVDLRANATATLDLALPREVEAPLVRIEDNNLILRQPIEFTAGTGEVTANSAIVIRELAQYLQSQTNIARVDILAHTDNQGERADNLALSQVRAEAIRTRLTEYGVQPARLSATGLGPDRPLYPHDTPEHRAKNSRIQFVIQQASATSAPGKTAP